KRFKVSGLGGVPSYITSSAQIKITLGWRVVYVMDVWVTNIGEEVDVLLGMDFMLSAGVRIGIHEGMVGLPDEESILMYGYTVRRREYRDIPVCPLRGLHLRPGGVAIRYGQCRPLQDVVWAGRGDQWVTQIVYGARSWAVAIKVVNVSDRDCWIEPRTPVARIAEYGNIPIVGQLVRPGLRRYMEWQQIIQENTLTEGEDASGCGSACSHGSQVQVANEVTSEAKGTRASLGHEDCGRAATAERRRGRGIS
ncbi:hypothetical protein PHMEG_00030056, partial [Phytophthora megakarya]